MYVYTVCVIICVCSECACACDVKVPTTRTYVYTHTFLSYEGNWKGGYEAKVSFIPQRHVAIPFSRPCRTLCMV